MIWCVALCLALSLALGFTGAPAWAHVLGVALCGLCGLMLWQGHALAAAPAPAAPMSSGEPEAVAVPSADPHNEAMRLAEQEMLRYALSHDLRAPLRVIDGFTRIVKEDHGRHLDRLGNDHLDRVLAASARMSGMIDALLAQAQLESESLERCPVDLSALAREVCAELAPSHRGGGDHHAQPIWRVAEGLHAEADPQLVRRVLENLLGNALKYSAKVPQPNIEFGAMPATHPTVFFVRDNGAGFDMQHADKLFGMFQRLHSAKDFEGTGVGLAGVRNIVRRHGGRVWAEATPGQGACFYFTLQRAVVVSPA
jgi:signal transduction histidine kinase